MLYFQIGDARLVNQITPLLNNDEDSVLCLLSRIVDCNKDDFEGNTFRVREAQYLDVKVQFLRSISLLESTNTSPILLASTRWLCAPPSSGKKANQ